MKIKWSTGIIITIVAFIGFIMSMVLVMMTNKKYDHDLVTEKYYQKELAYQTDINAIKNARKLKHGIKIEVLKKGLKIIFPSNFIPKNIKGSVFLYRPSNKYLDVKIPIVARDSVMLIPQRFLVAGRWNISVAFIYQKKSYLHEEQFNL